MNKLGCRPGITLEHRLAEYTIPEPNSGCHLWIGTTDDKGYAQLGVNGKLVRVHRLVYKIETGVEPPVVRHTCDVTCCIRFHHLVGGSQQENIQDMDKRGRRRVGQGERHGLSKLTEKAVRQIRKEYATGEVTFAEIGRRLGVHYRTIARVVKRKGWKHV